MRRSTSLSSRVSYTAWGQSAGTERDFERREFYFKRLPRSQRTLIGRGERHVQTELADCLANLGNVYGALKRWQHAWGAYQRRYASGPSWPRRIWTTTATPWSCCITISVRIHQRLGAWQDAHDQYVAAVRLVDTPNSANRMGNLALLTPEVFITLAKLLRTTNTATGWPSYHTAFEFLSQGCHLAERCRRELRVADARQRFLQRLVELYALHVENCLDLWREQRGDATVCRMALAEAVWASECIRSRQLLDQLGAANVTLMKAPPAQWLEDLSRTNLAINQRTRRAEATNTGRDCGGIPTKAPKTTRIEYPFVQDLESNAPRAEFDEAPEEVAALKRTRRCAIKRIRKFYEEGTYEAGIEAKSAEDLCRNIPDDEPTAVVQFSVMPGSALLVLSSSGSQGSRSFRLAFPRCQASG